MKPVIVSRVALLVVILISTFAAGCGKSDESNADAPKGTAQRNDVQAVPLGGGSSQQSMSSVKKPSFDNSK